MKRISFIVFFLLLIITILYYFTNNNNIKTNTTSSENIEVYYPSYNITKLDNYIDSFVEEIIKLHKQEYNGAKLYLDYDIDVDNKNIHTTFYTYIENENILKTNITKITYNKINKEIIKDNEILVTSNNYDFINNRIIDKDKKLVALTFDDGPSYNTMKIVDILKKYNSTATFFVVGQKVDKYKNTIKYLSDNNMEIANHTYTHKLLSKLDETSILKEIKDTQEAIYKITNTYPTLFRPSYGTVSSKLKRISPMPIIIWNLDTLDWKHHNSKKIANKILSNVSDGDIILMHDTYTASRNAVEIVIPKLKEQGYEIVSVSELFYYKNVVPINGKYYGYIK